MIRPAPMLALVVPCFNEAETLPHTMDTLAELLRRLKAQGSITEDSYVLYVDDGSHDGTWHILRQRHTEDATCKAVKFAGNAGHQNALLAGMRTARDGGVDAIISLDADLQDDISVIPAMVEHYRQGCDMVFGVRNDRSTDTFFKRTTAYLFYRAMELLQVRLIPNHADFRLVARPALEALENYGEQHPFLRGIFPAMGFRTTQVLYKRLTRQAGVTKYPLLKMFSFAWKGLTSLSAAPLRLAGLLGLMGTVLALLLSIMALVDYFGGETVSGWTSLIIVVLFMGSVQLICLSVMGEYIAKMFEEVKRRPRYIVETVLS